MSAAPHDTTILRCLFDDLSADEFAALNDTLRDNPAARAAAIRLTRIAAALHTHRATLSDSPTKTQSPLKPGDARVPGRTPAPPISAAGVPIYRKGYEPQPFKLRPHHFAVAAAALLIAGLAVGLYSAVAYYQHQVELEKEQAAIAAARDAQPVATLIQRTGNLTTPSGYPADGRDYGRGEYALSSGTAEFMLTNAVNVKLHGDTRMRMHNDMNVSLNRGSAEFVCPEGAKGFTVRLPDKSKIIDLGTAFRVELDEDGRAIVHVTEGRVEWAGTVPGTPVVTIEAGYAARMVDGVPVGSALQLIQWQPPIPVTTIGDGVIETEGELLEAINLGSSTDSMINSVVFTGQSTGRPNRYADLSAFDQRVAGQGVYRDGAIGAAFEQLMDSFAFGGERARFVLKNLTPGTRYRIQLLVSDDRNPDTESDGQSYTSEIESDPIQHGLSYALAGTFVAQSQTQTITLTHYSKFPVVAREARVNGYQLRALDAASSSSDVESVTDGPAP